MNTPPLLTPDGAASPLPTVVERRLTSHHVGYAWTVSAGSVTVAASALSVLSRSAIDTLALPALVGVNHAESSEVMLQ